MLCAGVRKVAASFFMIAVKLTVFSFLSLVATLHWYAVTAIRLFNLLETTRLVLNSHFKITVRLRVEICLRPISPRANYLVTVT